MPELVSSLILLQLRTPTVLNASGCFPMLSSLVDILDNFNQLAPGLRKEDDEDLAWSGICGKNDISETSDHDQLLVGVTVLIFGRYAATPNSWLSKEH